MSPAPAPVRSSTRTVVEIAQEAGERFEEAAAHLRSLDEFASFQLGAGGPVPMERLSPGVVAWASQLRWAPLASKSAGAELVYLIAPRSSSRASPIRVGSPSRVRLRVSPIDGPGTALLALSAGALPSKVQTYVRRLAKVLQAGDE
jgi:hypothetical protein